MSKKKKFEEERVELRPKLCLLRQSGQNIWNTIEKFSKTEQGKKSLISTFAWFLTAIAKV